MSKPAKGKGAYEQWSPQESRELLRILVDEANNGARQADGSFSKNLITTKVLPMLNSKLQCNKTYDHVRSKLRVWKRTFKPVAELMKSNSGFGWDPFSKKITAPEEVWDAYIMAHPEAANYRMKTIEEFEDLKTIMGQGFTVGSYAAQVSEAGIDIDNGGDDFVDIALGDDIGNGGDHFVDDAPSHVPLSHSTTSTMQRKRKNEGDTSSRQRARLAVDHNEVLVESFVELVSEMKALNPKNAAHANWLKALNEIPNLERDLLYRAHELLNTREVKEQFIQMDVEARKDFLRWKSKNRSI
ncbi:uncharacterized protein At2g29880-like [Tasmannia lanceolata]|uniref:uncharacterized protein At2g29880-like n=1 Tax=Tasmannia lanceolata TaxID=3420 RepID=UPI0040627F31